LTVKIEMQEKKREIERERERERESDHIERTFCYFRLKFESKEEKKTAHINPFVAGLSPSNVFFFYLKLNILPKNFITFHEIS
jgi:hypothetical protein